MLNLSKKYYNKILIICVLNEINNNDNKKLKDYLYNISNIEFVILLFSDYKKNYESKIKNKINNFTYIELKKKYLSSYKESHKLIYNPDNYYNSLIQLYQVVIGINFLINYINYYNIYFDVICKTRFDAKYYDDFYPHIIKSKNILDILSFNEQNKILIKKYMINYNIKNIDDLIEFNKINKLSDPYSHIKDEHFALSFGGMVCYNYNSLENIKNNNFKNILYSFDDYYYFSNQDTFLHLCTRI